MAKPLLTDALWQRIEPLLPPPKLRRVRFPGRQPLSNRQALTGILFVLKTGIPWEYLPQEMGCGSGMTCWRRLRDWHDAGVWERLHHALLQELEDADELDWERSAIDSAKVRSLGGGERTGKNPTDRAKLGSKHHVLVAGQGVPLAAEVSGANTHDLKGLVPLLSGLPTLGPKGETFLPKRLYGDRAYDPEPHRQLLRWLGITPYVAKRRTEHGSGLGVYRWVVERTLGWLHNFGRLRRRRERRRDIHQAFLKLGCSRITLNYITGPFC